MFTSFTRSARRALTGAALTLALGWMAPVASADYGGWQLGGFSDQPNLSLTLNTLLGAGTNIREMASTFGGGWVIITDSPNQVLHWGGPVPSSCIVKIQEYIQSGREIDVVAFTPGDGWMVIAEELAWHAGPMSYVPELEAAILDRIGAGKRLTELVFDADADGWTLLSNDGGWATSKAMPSDLYAAILERHAHDRTIQRIQMDHEGNWVLFAGDWFASRSIDGTAFKWIKDFQRLERQLDNIMLGPGHGWVLFSHHTFQPDFSNPMEAIEYGLKGLNPDGTNVSNIYQRMEDLDVAGVTLGVIENNRLRWARGYGELKAGTQDWVRTDSPFDTASLSKTVSSMLFQNLVDDANFPIHLDINVKQAAIWGPVLFWNDLLFWAWFGPQLKGAMPYTQLTLRRLLSHSAATLPHGSTSFKPGQAPPSTLEILFGINYEDGDAVYGGSNMPWYAEDLFDDGGSYQPGEVYKYSGGGYMIAQAMMEAVTGQDFLVLMQDRVIGPLGLNDTTFVAPLPPIFADRAAVPHDSNGDPLAPADRKYYPWQAAGGMWSTPTDLAQCVLTLMNLGTHPQYGDVILGAQSTLNMMSKQTPVGESKRYGLGLSLSADSVSHFDNEWFAHGGDHSEAAAYLAGSPGRGEGFVIMINGGAEDGAETLRSEIYAEFKDVYGWN
jgi:CubicO group peptidase (beta-lactamase class C family)